MSRSSFGRFLLCVVMILVVLAAPPSGWGQHTQGRINVTVLDQQGAAVPGAKLELQDVATNDRRTTETQSAGTYSFVDLPLGKYKLTISKDGFQKAAFDVLVQATKTTDVVATLQVGSVSQVVEVGAVAPVVETTANAIGSVIDLKHIEGLPITGRDITQLSRLTPGYGGTPAARPDGSGAAGTWNGLPAIAQGSNMDGVEAGPTRMKFSGLQQSVQARLENIEEMTVQTDQLDTNQGFGRAGMQINFVTRRGTNVWHGSIYEDHRNAALNANSWSNNVNRVKKPPFILNDFGGNLGGPIFKNKLFFFFSLATARQPGSVSRRNTFVTPSAQAGNYTYVGTDGQTRTVNLFQVAQGFSPTLPTSTNSVIASQLTRINQAVQSGSVTPTTNLNISSVNWVSPAPQTWWFPTVRLDYHPLQSLRMNLVVNRTKQDQPGANNPYFPGSDFAKVAGGNKFDGYTASYGVDWTVSPRLINSFRAGYLYNLQSFSYNSSRDYVTNPVTVPFPVADPNNPNVTIGSPLNFYVPVTSYYPVFNASDTATWQKGPHTINFGFSFYREQDHYWNAPELTHINLGLVQGDPALDALTNTGPYQPLPFATTFQQGDAQNLYALLTGRISGVNGSFPYDPKTGQYIQKPALAFNLDELSKAWGLFAQDSWRTLPTLTINVGLRWDFTGDNHDLNNAYHNADVSSLYGPSGIGNLFKPGTLTGNQTPTLEERPHPYNSWNVSPQPSLGIAWAPRFENGILRKVAGREDTVIRSSFSLRRFTVPYQYFWNNASDYGSFFYQFYNLFSRNVPGVGNFTPGSLSLGQTLPPFFVSPSSYQKVVPASTFTFNNGQFSNGVNGMKFNIAQPYTMTWTLGIQRKLGASRALEVRYSANRTLKQWIGLNLNEVNVFENGFLQEFKNAQNNLRINGGGSFANLNPAAGTVPLPILTAAFTGSTTGSQTNTNFQNGTFITWLNTGQVGALAQRLTTVGAAPYFCNLVGASFTPCAVNAGYTGAGAGLPINFFQANPYASGIPVLEMTDAGSSNYHALQVDFRQRPWHGVQFDANYTWSHTLGVSTPNDWTGSYSAYTLRDLRESYGPTLFDLRHVVHVSATYDLPFGRGRQFANRSGVVDRVVGGWSLGTITTYQTGFPFRVLGGYSTFNNIADGGVILNGVTREQLQNAIGVFKTPGQTFVTLIDPQYRTLNVGANTAFVTANTTPGVFTSPLWLHGPRGFYDDIMISKAIPFTERWRFTFQSEFLNAFNHPVFGQGTVPIGGNVRGSGWATSTGQSNAPRVIEFRAKISF